MCSLLHAITLYREEDKKIHVISNKYTNFENPDIEEIKKDGWQPIYKNGKIIEWK